MATNRPLRFRIYYAATALLALLWLAGVVTLLFDAELAHRLLGLTAASALVLMVPLVAEIAWHRWQASRR